MTTMTDDQVRQFLTARPARTAKLATTRADGRPHVAPVWYAVDEDGSLLLTTGARTVKGRNLRRDPRVAVCVEDDRPPFSFVVIEGTAILDEDVGHMRPWAEVIGGRYMGEDQAKALAARNAVPGEMLVRIPPDKVNAQKDIAE
jgi:PPOX class probable F420-dependent enzyme